MARTAEARPAVTTPDRRYKPEPEPVYVSWSVVETARRQVKGLRQATAGLSEIWDKVGDAARQKLSEVRLEMDRLANVLSFWTTFPDRGAYIDLEPHELTEEAGWGGRTVVWVSAGAINASTSNLQMLVSCFYPEEREGMRIIRNPKRDALLRKLMDGKPLRISLRSR